MAFFKKRLLLTVDAYIKKTDDLLYNILIPKETGFSKITGNVGSIENRGLEISLSGTPVRTDNFRWFSSFNISFNKNKVLQLADKDGFETDNGAYFVEEGESIGNMYGFKNLGVFQYDESNAFTENGTRLTPNFDQNDNFVNYTLDGQEYSGTVNQLKFLNKVLLGGDIIWEDQNEDFNIDVLDDRVTIGNGLPDMIGGFRNTFVYKSLSLSFLFDFNFGNDIYNYYEHERDKSSASGRTPGPDRIVNSWQNQGDDAAHPILLSKRSNNRTGFDSNYVSKGDFIRLKNINMKFCFPKSVMKKLNFIDDLSLNAVVNNIVTFTNYDGYNPSVGSRGNALEPGWDTLRYPNKIEFVFGINAQF